jgi:hypothetical protein
MEDFMVYLAILSQYWHRGTEENKGEIGARLTGSPSETNPENYHCINPPGAFLPEFN